MFGTITCVRILLLLCSSPFHCAYFVPATNRFHCNNELQHTKMINSNRRQTKSVISFFFFPSTVFDNRQVDQLILISYWTERKILKENWRNCKECQFLLDGPSNKRTHSFATHLAVLTFFSKWNALAKEPMEFRPYKRVSRKWCEKETEKKRKTIIIRKFVGRA